MIVPRMPILNMSGLIGMYRIGLLCLCAVLGNLLPTTRAQVVFDDTIAPLTVVPNTTSASAFKYHMAHFGQIPYGFTVDGCVRPQLSQNSPLPHSAVVQVR